MERSYPRADRRGALMLTGFAFAWTAAGASALPWAVLGWAVIAGAAATALLVGRAALRTNPGGADPPPDVMRRFGAVNIAQAVAIAAVVATFIAAGTEAFIPAAVCLIVGLHFIPLAPAFRQSLYRRLAAELGLIAVVGFVVALIEPAAALPVVGLGAASALVEIAGRLIASARRAEPATRGSQVAAPSS